MVAETVFRRIPVVLLVAPLLCQSVLDLSADGGSAGSVGDGLGNGDEDEDSDDLRKVRR